MSETDELEPAAAPAEATGQPSPDRRLWPWVTGAVIAVVIVVTGTVHGLGAKGALIAGGCVAAVAAVVMILWRLPHLRKHFAGPRRGARVSRMRLGSGGRRGTGLAGKGRGLLGRAGGRGGGRSGAGRMRGLLGRAGGRGGARGLLPKGGKRPAGGTGGRLRGLLGGRRRGSGKAGTSGGKTSAGRRGLGRFLPRGMRRGAKGAGAGTGKPGGKKPAARRGPATSRSARRRRGWVRRALRAVRGSYRHGRRIASGGKKHGRARRAAEAAAAIALLPAIGALAAWRRLRARRARRREPDEPPEDPAPAEEPPERKPGAPLEPKTTPKEARKLSAIESACEAITDQIGGFEPENVGVLDQFLEDFPKVFESFASALTSLGGRLGDEYPVDAQISEALSEIAGQLAGMQDTCAELYPLWRTAHEEDLKRIEEPRTNEEFLDASNQ
jgi:hypothetical protein